MNWQGLEKEMDGMERSRLVRLQLEVERVLIGLMKAEGWSSRVQADKIVEHVAKTVLGQRVPEDTKPWEALDCQSSEDV
jgi:hypothetical protein